jgi:GNAT superfamily N-acetyltransferase
LPATFFNRVIGLGNEAPAASADLDNIAEQFASSNITDYWIHLSRGARPADIASLLAARGFTPPARRTWSKFLRNTTSPPPSRTDLQVRLARADDAAAIARVVVTAYGLPPFIGPWFESLVGRANWQVWLAECDGAIVATGALFIDGRQGWLGVGATLPTHRGRGAQGSLLAARIRAAGEAGCEAVVTETGDPVGEEKNTSLDNIRRAGFEWVCSRANFAAPKPGESKAAPA